MNNYAAWQIDAKEFPYEAGLKEQIIFISGYGLIAPSVHNTQPWRFDLGENTLSIYVDQDRKLQHGDPTERQTTISIGACAESMILAAQDFGMSPKMEIKRTENNGLVATIEFSKSLRKNKNYEWLDLMRTRTTNRSIFDKQPLDPSILSKIQKSWISPSVLVEVSSSYDVIHLVSNLSARSIGMALTIPKFRNELTKQIRTNNTRLGDGMTGKNLHPGKATSFLTPLRYKHKSIAISDSKHENAKLESSSAIILIFTKGDTAEFWLEAGRAYLHTVLEACRQSVDHSTHAAAIEAPDFHQEIENLFNTNFRLQTITRIGHSKVRAVHSPRRKLEDIITSV